MSQAQITKTFSAVGSTARMLIKKGEHLLYKADVLASWDGTVLLRFTKDGGLTVDTVATITATDIDGATIEALEDGVYYFECTVFTAGTLAVVLTNLSADELALPGAGIAVGGTTVAEERGDGVTHQTLLRLTDVPLSCVSVTTGAGVGGAKVYDFPAGRILILGTMGQLALSVAAANQADFTDATPAGDIGIGTVLPANADGLGTDATDDDLCTALALTMANYNSSSDLISEASLQHDGVTTAKDMNINVLIDAGDIDDDTTSEILCSGWIMCTWINLGDV